ncbi:MAG: hypothetical protein E7172_06660 [Firmicutes bacterium]|nr:hypothetical protein [Bacillota bacterium]
MRLFIFYFFSKNFRFFFDFFSIFFRFFFDFFSTFFRLAICFVKCYIWYSSVNYCKMAILL